MVSNAFNLLRTLMAIGGSAGVALSSFVLSFALLNSVSAAEFGLFAFIQVVIGLGFGLSNAVLGSPLMVLLNREDTSENNVSAVCLAFCRANLLLASLLAMSLAILISMLEGGAGVAALFGISALINWLRWYGRSQANAVGQHRRVIFSDMGFSTTIMVGVVVLFLIGGVSLHNFALLQGGAAVLGVLMLGKNFVADTWNGAFFGSLSLFRESYSLHGKHALVGVITTEATANAHAYLVTFLLGPAAFAPLAAALLIFRPIPVIIMTITQFERPRLARLLRERQWTTVVANIRWFNWGMIAIWLSNALLALLLVEVFVEYVVAEVQETTVMTLALVLWTGIMLFRAMRAAPSALLQANGNFQPLAKVTLISSFITLPLVLMMLLWLGAIWSLIGVLVGEIIAVALTVRLYRDTLRSLITGRGAALGVNEG